MGIRRVFVYLRRIHELLFDKGDSLDFTVVKYGEKRMVDKVLRSVLGIHPTKEVRLYRQTNVNSLIDYIGGYEHREVGDTCRMVLKFQNFDGEPLRYYAWEGIVPEDDDYTGYKLGIVRITPEDKYGIITGRGILKMVLIEKCRE
jgi:hypothetical protein